jgi:hypothetical protein
VNESLPSNGAMLTHNGMVLTDQLPGGELMTAPFRAVAKNDLVLHSCQARVMRPARRRSVLRYVVTYLKPSSSRPVLRYAVTYYDQERKVPVQKVLIGKGYYRGDGSLTFQAMNQLWLNGFAHDHLTIPEPLAYLAELSLLLQAQAPGKALYLYLDDPATALEFVRLTARWLAKLHRAGIDSPRVLLPAQDEEKLATYRAALVQACPRFAERLADLTDRTVASLTALPPGQVVPTHGDYQPKNILMHRNRVTVIDFDRFALTHPARDLGHFLGQCMTMSYVRTGSFEAIEPWNAAFLGEYERLMGSAALPALPAFIARTFLEVLYYKLVVRPVKDAYFLAPWLDECERWLDHPPAPAKDLGAERQGCGWDGQIRGIEKKPA